MARHRVRLGALTIASGAQESNILVAEELSMAEALVFYNASAYTGTVAVEVAANAGALAAAHAALEIDGTPLTLTAAIVEQWHCGGFRSIMLDSSSNEGADRVVEVYAILNIPE